MMLSILHKFKFIIFDLDGVLRIGKKIVPGANQILQYLQINNINHKIVTNECRYSNNELKNELLEIGLTNCKNTPIYTAGNSVCDYFENLIFNDHINTKEYHIGIVGEKGLTETLNQYSWDRDNIHIIKQPLLEIKEDINLWKNKYLVIGTLTIFRIEEINKCYEWINAGAKVLLTCPDTAEPSSRSDFDIILPKHIIHILKYNLKFDYEALGKPHPLIEENLTESVSNIKNKKEILFVGDTLNTDIQLALNAGWSKCLVLSGNSNQEITDTQQHNIEYIVKDVSELLNLKI